MTRSNWASWEPSRGSVGTVASDCAVRAEFENRTPRERMRPRPWVSPTNYLLTLMVASLLVIAAAPNVAFAASVRSSHAQPGSGRGEQPSGRAARKAVAVLAPGSGYSSRRDAVRVRAVQRRLARAGYVPGPIDGLFGPLTQRAVDRFQASQGLRADGIVGPLTVAALRRAPTLMSPGLGYPGPGSSNVRVLQRRLSEAGYRPGPIDGRYGPRTERAVARYQAANGLQSDGIAGPRTLATMSHVKAPGRHRGVHHPRPGGAHHHTGQVPSRPRRPAHRAHARPPRVPTHRNAPQAKHPSGSPSAGLVLLLIALALALGLAAIWSIRRRRRFAGESGTGQSGAEPVAPPLPAATPEPVIDRARQPEPKAEPEPEAKPEPRPEPGEASDAERLFQHGVAFDQEGNVEQSMRAYAEADRLGHAAAACNLGVLLERQGDMEAASAAFRRADERGHADGTFNLGFRLEEQGDLIGAAEAYHRADQLGHAAAASNLGILLEQRGDRTGALATFARAARRGDSAGAFNLAVLLEEQGDRVAAMRVYERAARLGDGAAAERARAAVGELRSQLANHAGMREGGGGYGS
jgi:peptidoglycan hydrolase-like protein with peptidoglycan-binding domain/tetratricopeptide (TPR) repeat protein